MAIYIEWKSKNKSQIRRGRVRRAKLYYLRALSGKKARIREKRETPKP